MTLDCLKFEKHATVYISIGRKDSTTCLEVRTKNRRNVTLMESLRCLSKGGSTVLTNLEFIKFL